MMNPISSVVLPNTPSSMMRNQVQSQVKNQVKNKKKTKKGGKCKIGVIVDNSFLQTHRNDPESFIRNSISAASDNIFAAFDISLSIEFIDLKNKIAPEGVRVIDFFQSLANSDAKFSDLCFVVGLTDSEIGSKGLALGNSPVGFACRGQALVARNSGSEKDMISVLTHEIGHMLGADHDDFIDSCKGEGFVMDSIVLRDHPNALKFSSCSIDAIEPRLPGFQCLY